MSMTLLKAVRLSKLGTKYNVLAAFAYLPIVHSYRYTYKKTAAFGLYRAISKELQLGITTAAGNSQLPVQCPSSTHQPPITRAGVPHGVTSTNQASADHVI